MNVITLTSQTYISRFLHPSPDCVVVPVLNVSAGGADRGVAVTAVEPQSLA